MIDDDRIDIAKEESMRSDPQPRLADAIASAFVPARPALLAAILTLALPAIPLAAHRVLGRARQHGPASG